MHSYCGSGKEMQLKEHPTWWRPPTWQPLHPRPPLAVHCRTMAAHWRHPPGLPISCWWSWVFSLVLSQHCATGIGASSPVHAAVVAPRSDWTAQSETSSAEHPCRHDNLPISQQGCASGRLGWRLGILRRVPFCLPTWKKATVIHFASSLLLALTVLRLS